MEIKFKYSVNQRILDPFGGQGIITMCAVDDGGKQYYVKNNSGGNWYKENELTFYEGAQVMEIEKKG